MSGDFDPSIGPGGLEPLPDEADNDNEPIDTSPDGGERQAA